MIVFDTKSLEEEFSNYMQHIESYSPFLQAQLPSYLEPTNKRTAVHLNLQDKESLLWRYESEDGLKRPKHNQSTTSMESVGDPHSMEQESMQVAADTPSNPGNLRKSAPF